MPRVTRRSLASKEESSSEEITTSRSRRGAKKEEPIEDVAAEEPQEPSTKRSRQATKGGRSTSRPRGKKTEPEEEEEEAEEDVDDKEEEEVKTPKEGNRGRGKARGGRGSAKGKSVAATEEETTDHKDEEMEAAVSEEVSSEATQTTKGRRGKVAVTPSPKGGRRARGRSAGKGEEESTSGEIGAGDGENAEMSEQPSTDVESETSGRPRRSTPASGGRRSGRSKKSEEATPPARSSRRSRGPAVATEEEELKCEEQESIKNPVTETAPVKSFETDGEEAMDTKEDKVQTIQKKTEVGLVSSESKSAEISPGKKRKLDEEEKPSAKRARNSEGETSGAENAGTEDELKEFVVVNKEDVPAPDSLEVLDSVAKAAHVEPAKDETAEASDAKKESKAPEVIMLAPNLPTVVPLTEAELTKQYTNILGEKDRDEISSTIVEVGSEAASDITAVSMRGLDVGDAMSMDSVSMDQPQDTVQTDSSHNSNAMDTSTVTEAEVAASPIATTAQPVQENNIPAPLTVTPQDTTSQPAAFAQISAAATGVIISATQSPVPTAEPILIPSHTPAAPNATPTPTSPVLNTAKPTLPPPQITAIPQVKTQNGTLQGSVPMSPLLTPTPAKAPVTNPGEKYIASSPAIDKRKFIANPNFPVELMDPAFCFSVVTYNILADCHLRRWDYSYTEEQYLNQTYRHNLMMKELDFLDGDIICLQEVDPTYYANILKPALVSRGYTGDYIKRNKDYWNEGEATFVKNNKFEVHSSQGISLKDLAYKEVDAAGLSEDVASAAKRYLDRADVILLTQLVCKKTGKQLTVCNIHVVYDTTAPDVQCVQVASAIKELVCKAGNDLNPHIICGDFNSETTGPGYQLAKDGYLNDNHIRNLQAIERMDNKDSSSRSMIHHLWRAFQHTSSNLKSAYETVMGKEPMVTSYNRITYSALDYIFHSSSSLEVAGVLEILDRQVVDATGGVPAKDIPSDHLSVKAVFRVKE